MRVRGNIYPDLITIEDYMPISGYVEVHIRENIKEIKEYSDSIEKEINLFQYDEYIFHLKKYEGIEEDIKKNLKDWLLTGYTLEYNQNASGVKQLEDQNNQFLKDFSELDEAYKKGVNSV